MEVDREFSALSTEVGMNKAFLEYCAIDGVLLRPGSMPLVGRHIISETLLKNDDSQAGII